MDEPSGAQPLVATPGKEESEAAFSPDGRWIAYESDEAGRFDVYVKGYPDGPRTVVSPEGGGRPVWNPKTGGEVFYQNGARPSSASPSRTAGVSVQRSVSSNGGAPEDRNWDVAPDGQHFLVAEDVGPQRINVVTNWLEELKAKVKGKTSLR